MPFSTKTLFSPLSLLLLTFFLSLPVTSPNSFCSFQLLPKAAQVTFSTSHKIYESSMSHEVSLAAYFLPFSRSLSSFHPCPSSQHTGSAAPAPRLAAKSRTTFLRSTNE